MTPKGRLEEFAAHVRGVKAQAREGGRELDVYTVAVVTCRPTKREAEEYYRHCVIDNADWAAVDRIMAMRGVTRERFPDDFEERRVHQANGMGGMPVVGDPDDVAAELAQLAAAGARGIALSFVNYLDEVPFFAQEVLPRLGADGPAGSSLVAEPNCTLSVRPCTGRGASPLLMNYPMGHSLCCCASEAVHDRLSGRDCAPDR